tara:strand:+ start:250 stop:438 length:189 start_codon:yes stop_codon:yes gene_type:complete
MKQEINFLHSEIRNLEKLNLEKDKLIKSLKSQVETKTKIINFYENKNYKNLVKTSLLLTNSL